MMNECEENVMSVLTTKNAAPDPVREYLQSVYGLKLEIARLTERVRTVQAQCEKMTTVLTGMPRGGGSDPERLLAVLADERATLNGRLLKAEVQTREVENFIARVPDRLYREILSRRYVDCLRWPQVLEKLQAQGDYYEERQMFRLHGKAMNAARKLWAEEHEAGDSEGGIADKNSDGTDPKRQALAHGRNVLGGDS